MQSPENKETSASQGDMPLNRAETAKADVLPPIRYTGTREEAKEAIRLAYVSGRAKLVHLAVKYQVPYETVMRWSCEGDWKESKYEAGVKSAGLVTEKAAEWIVQERERQIRATIQAADTHRALLAKVAEEGDVYSTEAGPIQGPMGAKGAAQLASGLKSVTESVMAILGMNQNANAGRQASVHILSTGPLTVSEG